MEPDDGARKLAELLLLGAGSPTPEPPLPPRGRISHVEKLLHAFQDAARPVVVLHDHPDPDAIGSAFALAHLLAVRQQLQPVLVHGGVIARAENRALVEELKIQLVPAAGFSWDGVDRVALVDCQPSSGNHALPKGLVPTVVLDHHPICQEPPPETLADIRPDYGATCTILTEYLEDAHVHIDERLATALFYGIKTDTQDLGRQASGIDALAYLRLFVAADKRTLSRVQNPRLPRRYYRAMHDAFERTSVYGDVAVAQLGPLVMPETTGETADLIVRLEGMRWSLVLGQFEQRLLFSVRATDVTADAGRVAEQLAFGRGHAGGHWRLAGGAFNLAGKSDDERAAIERDVVQRFLAIVGAATPEGAPLIQEDEA